MGLRSHHIHDHNYERLHVNDVDYRGYNTVTLDLVDPPRSPQILWEGYGGQALDDHARPPDHPSPPHLPGVPCHFSDPP